MTAENSAPGHYCTLRCLPSAKDRNRIYDSTSALLNAGTCMSPGMRSFFSNASFISFLKRGAELAGVIVVSRHYASTDFDAPIPYLSTVHTAPNVIDLVTF